MCICIVAHIFTLTWACKRMEYKKVALDNAIQKGTLKASRDLADLALYSHVFLCLPVEGLCMCELCSFWGNLIKHGYEGKDLSF